MLLSRALTVAALVALPWAGPGQQAQDPPPPPADVAGKWTASLEMEIGTSTVTLVLEQDDAKLTGTYTGRYGTYPLAGAVEGRKLAFDVTITAEGMQSLLRFQGQVAEDGQSMKGDATFEGLGAVTWFAKRIPSQLATNN